MKLVQTSELEPGDVLAKEIYTSQGVTLLKEGTKLNTEYINRLKKLRIKRVYIKTAVDKETTSKHQKRIKVAPERVKQEAVVIARGCIKKINKSEKMNFNKNKRKEIMNLVENVVDMISNNDDLLYNLKDIRLLEDELFFHSSNVLVLSLVMGKKLGYRKERLKILGLGAFLHDIGKAQIPSEILDKPGELTEEEFEQVKEHTVEGYELLKELDGVPERAARVAYEHHERCDGSGYPKGIKKRFISEYARIVAVVDVFDSMINERVYRDALHVKEVIEFLYTRFTKNKMDRDLIEIFLEVVTPYPVGTRLKLSIGAEAVVTEVNENNKLRPVVRVVDMPSMDEKFEIDLSNNLYISIEKVLS